MRSAVILLGLALWGMAAGEIAGQSWVQKVGGPGLGNPLAVNPLTDDIVYGAAGNDRIFISRDRGYTWANHGDPVTGGGIIKSVAVSPLDTQHILVGMESSSGSPDRIMKSTDGGLSWVETWSGTFSYFGQPVEFSPLHPDTVYTMDLDTLYRSVDFGSSWDTVATGRGFNAWCDASIRPDSASVIYIGDNLSGIWKTTDHGSSWRKTYSTIGEIPSIAIDPLDPRVAYAGKFGGGGGIVKTTDWGETWHSLAVPSGAVDTWWVTCSPVHPGFVYYGTYTGDSAAWGIYISRDSGGSWQRIREGLPEISKFNYGLLALDSLTVLALQASGIFRYQYPVSLDLLSPTDGASLLSGSQFTLSWTAAGLYYVRLDFSSDNGQTWNEIADSIPASETSWLWTVPGVISDSCLIRVSDALFTDTSDGNEGIFAIIGEPVTLTGPNGGEVWAAGSARMITWSSATIDSLRIEYTTNNGITWPLVTRVAADPGVYEWTVPNTPTTLGRVRLRAVSDTTVLDGSDSVFSIVSYSAFTGSVVVTDDGSGRDTLVFGIIPGATDGIDTPLGETALAPVPPPGTFDARWLIAGTGGSKTDYRDTLDGLAGRNVYVGRMQPGPAGYPLRLAWNPKSLVAGTYILRDRVKGAKTYSVDMRRDSVLVVSDTSAGEMEIVQCSGVEIVIPGEGGWVLTSLPVETGDTRVSTLFPLAPTGAFEYSNGYDRRDTLEPGKGYWIKTEQVALTGCPITTDTVDIDTGWNMVGALAVDIGTASISSDPESLIVSQFFGYSDAGYFPVDTLKAGNGYWVKSKSSGRIVLEAGVLTGKVRGTGEGGIRDLSTIQVRKPGGSGSTLFFGPAAGSSRWETPPPPPNGQKMAFFRGGDIAVFHQYFLNFPFESEIIIDTAESEINIDWNVDIKRNFVYILVEKVGNQEVSNTLLQGRGSIALPDPRKSSFFLRVHPRSIRSADRPRGFTVGEFFPNPFNPSTRINFFLPSESFVSYKFFNLLGEIVSSFDAVFYPAGEHSLRWDGRNSEGTPLSSGIYFLKMTATPSPDFTREAPGVVRVVRKLMLLR